EPSTRDDASTPNNASGAESPVPSPQSLSNALLFQQAHKLTWCLQPEQALRNVRLLGELRDLAEHRQILIRYLERRRHDQEEELHWLLVDRLEVHTFALSAKRHPQFVDHERPAVWNRYAPTDARGAEVLSALEHLEQHPLGLFVELEETDHFLEDLVF